MRWYGRIAQCSIVVPRGFAEGAQTAAAALLLAAVVAGCGATRISSRDAPNGSSSEQVARVDDVAISRSELDHWTHAIERGGLVATALGKLEGTPREKALEFLISAGWILGEAQGQGLSPSSTAIESALREKVNAVPNGRAAFEEELASTKRTLADVKLEVKSTLAVARLRDVVLSRLPGVTAAEVASYYARHRQDFYLPQRRVVYLLEGIRGYTHALAIANQVRPGTHLTAPWFREVVSKGLGVGDREKLERLIFATAPGRVTKPLMFIGRWTIAAVRKLIPAGIQPLASVRRELSRMLRTRHRERALKRFAMAFESKWTARTSCNASYVIQKCSQYRGALTQVSPLMGN